MNGPEDAENAQNDKKTGIPINICVKIGKDKNERKAKKRDDEE